MRHYDKLSPASKHSLRLFFIVFATILFFTELRPYQTGAYSERFFELKSLVDQGTFQMDMYKEYLGNDQSRYEGHTYSSHVPGATLIMIPFYLVVGKPFHYWLHHFTDWEESKRLERTAWVTQVATLGTLYGLVAVSLFKIFVSLGLRYDQAYWGSLLAYFGTSFFPYSTIVLIESLAVPFVVFSMLFLLKADFEPERGRLWWGLTGLMFAIVVSCKATNGLFVIGPGLFLLYTRWRRWDLIALYSVPIVLCVFLLLLHNKLVFDGWFNWNLKFYAPRGGEYQWYDKEGGMPPMFDTSKITLWRLMNMFVLPGRGLIYNAPFFIFAVGGLKALMNRGNPLGWPWLLGFTFFMTFMAGFYGPFAGAVVGWRIAMVTVPLLIIASCYFMLNDFNRIFPRYIAYSCVGWALFINITYGLAGTWCSPTGLRNALFFYSIPLLKELGPTTLISWEGKYQVINWIVSLSLLAAIAGYSYWTVHRDSESRSQLPTAQRNPQLS